MSIPSVLEAALSPLPHGCAIVRHTHSVNLRWANSALTTNGDVVNTDLTVIALDPAGDKSRAGVQSAQLGSPDDALRLARSALETSRDSGVLDGMDLPNGVVGEDFHSGPAFVSSQTTRSMMDAVAQFFESEHRQFGYAQADRTTTYLATSAGTRLRHVQSALRFEASARSRTGSTWWGTQSLDAGVAAAVSEQSGNLDLQQHREDLAPGRHRVVLTASAVADLMIYLAWTANARDAIEGHNAFARPGGGTRLGERLSPRSMSLFADPGYPGLECSDSVMVEVNSAMESVFDNGLAIARQDLINDGTLTALRASRPTAQRVGLASVYLADNLILDDAAGSGDLADLIGRTDDAVLINCLWYIREVDAQNLLLTGLTRDGVYRIRDGHVVAALPNFRFNVSVPEMLGAITDATATGLCLPREWADWFTRTAMPALTVENFNLSSPSDAL